LNVLPVTIAAMKYYISGRVLPERTDVHIDQFIRDIPLMGTLNFRCDASQIGMIFEKERDESTAVIIAKDYADTVISALGFTLGFGFSTEITQVLSESCSINVYGVLIPELRHENNPQNFRNYVIGVFGDIYLRYAIRDYLRTFREVMDCPFLCYKAIFAGAIRLSAELFTLAL
jgi:hypothetical protein